MDWDLIALDELIEKGRTERLDRAMEDLGYYTPYRERNTGSKPRAKKKKTVKKNLTKV